MLECPIPPRNSRQMRKAHPFPEAATVVLDPCEEATNVLKVHDRRRGGGGGGGTEGGDSSSDFAVCLKFLSATHVDRPVALR